jgi:hypothetical protein
VIRVLFDENVPRLLRRELAGFTIRTVQEEGWGAIRNGELLRRAEGRFDVLLTAVCSISRTSRPSASGVVVVVTPRLQLALFRTVLVEIRAASSTVSAGHVIHIRVPTP